MTNAWHEIIRRHSRPLQPRETDEATRVRDLTPIDAVLFDIYGTLLISDSGDIGSDDMPRRCAALRSALDTVGLSLGVAPETALETQRSEIQRRHHEARQAGIDYPEVDIVAIWRRTLSRWFEHGWLQTNPAIDPAALALEFEVRANPVWPMPGLVETLGRLNAAGKTLGVISNAQVFTPEIFPALTGHTLDELGCPPDLQIYSYRHGHAKPGPRLYDLAATALRCRKISAERVLYVGNDMRNDVAPAARCGFRTALFAGDARSLRRREGDPLCAGIIPDVVVTNLTDMVHCVG